MFKSVAGNIIAKNIISIIGAGYIYLVYITSNIKLHNRTNIEKILEKKESFIYAFWHDQLLMCPLTWKNESKIMVLISKHRDGDIISKVISYLGFSAIRGSTSKPTKIKSKGGILAARKMLKSLENGSSVGIALDGPRGPRHQVSEGPIQIARISNKMILPVVIGFKKKWALNTWDKFIIPKIFNTINIYWGKPIQVEGSKKNNLKFQDTLKKELDRLTLKANSFN